MNTYDSSELVEAIDKLVLDDKRKYYILPYTIKNKLFTDFYNGHITDLEKNGIKNLKNVKFLAKGGLGAVYIATGLFKGNTGVFNYFDPESYNKRIPDTAPPLAPALAPPPPPRHQIVVNPGKNI